MTNSSKHAHARQLSLHDLNGLVDQHRAKNPVCFVQSLLQNFPNVFLFGRERYNADDGALPDVLMIELRNGDVEFDALLVLQAAQNLPLILERLRISKVQLQRKQSYRHLDFQERFAAYFLPAGTPD